MAGSALCKITTTNREGPYRTQDPILRVKSHVNPDPGDQQKEHTTPPVRWGLDRVWLLFASGPPGQGGDGFVVLFGGMVRLLV